ncbi:MAG: hypothetical protein AAF333_16320 [Planctomycetota bacterium]
MSHLSFLIPIRVVFGCLLGVALVCPAVAIQPQRWTHSTEADFAEGETDGVVVTNLGDLKVATATDTLGELPEDVTVVYDVVEMEGVTLLAAGPTAKLLGVSDGEVFELIAFEGHQLFAILPIPGTNQVTVALSGGTAKLSQLAVDGQTASIVREIELPGVRYVWDMTTRNERRDLVLATGTDGKVLSLDTEGNVTELLDTAQANVLCLASGPEDSIFAGTDTDGLIYRIDADGSTYVVYDADEPEIGALLVNSDGVVYAGTADAEQARPGRLEDAAEEETGRPEPEGETPAGDAATPPAELPVEPAPQPLDAVPQAVVDGESGGGDAEVAEPDQAAVDPATDESASADPGDEIEAVGPPSPEQYDALREEIRKRLLAARKSGAMKAGKSTGSGGTARPTRNAQAASGGDKSGNAVYRIDPRGFVSEVFRESVMVLKLAEQSDGKLLVGTGNEGQLYRVDPANGETSVVNDLESQQLLALVVGEDGTVVVGGANPAALIALSDEPADGGSYTSTILDAGQISLWGTFLVTADFPAGGRIEIETRSGNVADPEIAAWSEWEEADSVSVPAGTVLDHPLETKIASPPARFLQYRLTLTRDQRVSNGGSSGTPVVGKVELAYVMPNLRPAITSLTAAYPDFPGVDNPASPTMSVNWETTDDNGDRLLYRLDYKPAAASPDQAWLNLAEDLTDTSFEWDTRKVPDGRYRLRVTADDRLDNPGDMAMTAGRLADPVLIDNTPPAVVDLVVKQTSAAEVMPATAKLSGLAADQYSPIHSVAYSLDGAEQYTPVLPEDLIYDSTKESWSATLRDLSPGGHAVTVRIIDGRGNATYASELFEIQ